MSVLQILSHPRSAPPRVPEFEKIRETIRTGPASALYVDGGPKMSMARIAALPEPEWARPQNADAARQAYADAEARIAAALYPQKLPVDTKRATAKTVRVGAQVAELLDLLAEGLEAVAGMPGGTAALCALVALADGEVSW